MIASRRDAQRTWPAKPQQPKPDYAAVLADAYASGEAHLAANPRPFRPSGTAAGDVRRSGPIAGYDF